MNAKRGIFHVVLLITLIVAQSFMPPAAAMAQSTTASNSMPAALYRAALDTTTQSASSPQYSNGSYQFSLNGMNAVLGSGGLALASQKGAAWNWDVQVDGFGRGASPTAVAGPKMSAAGGRVTYRYTGFSQWVRNTGIGLEQGFTIAQNPRGAGRLVLRMHLDTNLAGVLSKDARTLTFDTADGRTLYYSNLRVFDARNKELPANLIYTPNQIIIQVDDSHAVYPLTVDPLIYFETKIVVIDAATNDYFGTSVAISGNTAVVGAPDKNNFQGAAYIFQSSGATWIQKAELSASDGAPGDSFGVSVAISGNTVIVGAGDKNNAQGKAYIFVEPAGGWADMTQTAWFFAPDAVNGDQFGWSVAISGNTAVVGAPGKNSAQGKAYVFAEPGGGWANTSAETADLTASDGAANDGFGRSLALSDDTLIVGAPVKNSLQGKAYVFVKPPSGWASTSTFTAGLTTSEGLSGDEFGYSVAISGSTALVGAPGRATSAGKAYMFLEGFSGWATATDANVYLTASDGAANYHFGYAVSLSSDTAIVGAPFYNNNLIGGKAYVFVKPLAGWFFSAGHEDAQLSASDHSSGFGFGSSVAISGDTAVVGAPNENLFQGAAYVYSPNYFGSGTQDLSVQAFTGSSAPLPGQTVTLTTSVTNLSTSTSVPAVALNVPLPTGFTYVSSAASFGNYDSSNGVWSVGILAPDATATLSIQASPPSSLAGTQVVFSPSLLGSDSNSADNSASVSMAIPLLSFSPASVNFSSELIQNIDPPVTITATNLSSDSITLGTLSVPTGFVLSNDLCSAATLAPGETCAFGLGFKPASAVLYSTSVIIPATGPLVMTNLPVSGKGIAGTKLLTVNLSFESATLKVPNGWTKGGAWIAADGQDCTAFHNGSCSLKFTGKGKLKTLSYTVMHSGVSGDDFLFSLWNKAIRVPPAAPVDKALVQVYNGATLVTTATLNFAKGTHGFTQSSLGFSATSPYTKVVVTIEYTAASGTAWFDDASLTWAP